MIFSVMGILRATAQVIYWLKDRVFHPSCLEHKFARSRNEKVFQCGRHVVSCT